ncbi:hypothetical protein JW905_10145, partial [bacterium]|nr:hypothetical protein [candidate division CSSED10-310 bacterium]
MTREVIGFLQFVMAVVPGTVIARSPLADLRRYARRSSKGLSNHRLVPPSETRTIDRLRDKWQPDGSALSAADFRYTCPES